MDFGFSMDEIRKGLIFYIVFIASLCIREWARAWTVNRLGDPNPAAQGRVTLNPVAHMDLFGSVIFPLVCIFVFQSSFLFGWGKPVIPNPIYFANPKRGEILTALAGPAANLMVAFLAAIAFGVAHRFAPETQLLFTHYVLPVSVLLAVFNLLPVPPWDGGVLLKHLVGMSEETFHKISQWSLLVWLLLISIPAIQWVFVKVLMIFMLPFSIIYTLLAR